MWVIVALVVVAIVAALIFSGGGDDDGAASASGIPSSPDSQVAAVAVDGDVLPPHNPALPVDAAVGMQAPSITASYFDGQEVTIDFADGQPRVVLFVTHWCPHCQAEVPLLTEWFDESGLPTNVELVTISTSVDNGSPNYPPSSWLRREDWPLPVLRDSAQDELAGAFGLTGFPYSVGVRGDGTIVARGSGEKTVRDWALLFVQVT